MEIDSPEALARSKSCTERGASLSNLSVFTREIAPVRSFFLAVPYPITTTSSSSSISSLRVTSITRWLPTSIS